ncbi:MAG TPA: hypothetical protein VJY33_12060, partial [Isosphaeraceae bacterium]|nr:hypothetical protein [Isosphaeraceae bacterium]
STAANISNYSLILLNANGTQTDESQYITTATFTATAPTLAGQDVADYNGVINLTFSTGIPAGNYELIARTKEQTYPGLLDAAGNPLAQDFVYNFSLQSQPVFITDIAMESTYSNDGSTAIGGPRSYYELPSTVPGYVPRAAAPPTAWVIDLSNPIPYTDYSSLSANQLPVQLIGSADTAGGTPDGDFGNLGEGGLGSTGTGFHIVSSVSLALYNWDPATQTSTPVGPGGSGNRLVLTYSGGMLPADYYRIYMPNSVEPGGINTVIKDIYGNQLDGEFLGDATASLDLTDFPDQPPVSTQFSGIFNYEDELSTGVYRQGMSGTGVAGGAFMTSFVVVPPATTLTEADGTVETISNIIYARPDYVEDPLLPSTAPDGSLAKPYSTLAPEGDPATAPANEPRSQRRPELEPVLPLGFQLAVRSQRQWSVRPLGPLRRLATGLQGARCGHRLAGHAPAQSDYRRRDAADVRSPGAGRFQHHHQQRQRVGSLRHDAGVRPRVNAQA